MVWSDDGQGKTAAGAAAGVVVLREDVKGSKANAMWRGEPQDGVLEGEHFWEFTINDGEVCWVGLTTPAKFGAGWKCGGAMYGGPGNTSDGGGLVAGGFGEKIKPGDKIGLLLSIAEQPKRIVSVSFFHNSRALGEAFSIKQAAPVPLFPVVSMSKGGSSIAIQKVGQIPACRAREVPQYDGCEGYFRMQSLHGAEGEIDVQPTSLTVTKTDSGYKLSFKGGNNMGTSVTQVDGQWKALPMMSTMMMPPPEYRAIDNALSSIVGGLAEFDQSSDHISISGAGASAVFERQTPPVAAPCQRDVFS